MQGQSRLAAESLRFIAAGAANTAITFALYWLLLPVLGYARAYTAAFVLGIVIAFVLNARWVFLVKPSRRAATAFPLVYVAQWLAGLGILWLWSDVFGLPARWGVLAVVAITIPMTFLLSRFTLRHL